MAHAEEEAKEEQRREIGDRPRHSLFPPADPLADPAAIDATTLLIRPHLTKVKVASPGTPAYSAPAWAWHQDARAAIQCAS
jgi:hypothetical protein